MTWLLVFCLMLVVFANRYVLLEPKLPIVIPALVRQALAYSAPCLLTAICGPIILQGSGLQALPSNPYVYATAVSVACAYFIPNMLLSVVVSLASFYMLMALW